MRLVFGIIMTTEEQLEFALMGRLVAKAIHRLQRVGLNKDAQQLLDEAKELGIEIIIHPDPTIDRN